MEFTKLSAPSLKDMFIQEVENRILSGELAVGDKLPPEREIAQSMQVSRGVVNSGILELARKGFLTIKPRIGTFVADYRRTGTMETLKSIINYNKGILRSDEIRSILEIRLALSTLSLTLAIPQLPQRDIDILRSYTNGIAKAHTNKEASVQAFNFHHELAVLSGNMLMPLIYYSFREVVLSLWERFCVLHGREKLYNNTDKLLTLIEKKETEAAIRFSEQTINDAITGMNQIYY